MGFHTSKIFSDTDLRIGIMPTEKARLNMKQTKILTDETFNTAYIIIAGIVTKYGDAYLPVFKRMHEEKQQRQVNADLKAIAALTVAHNID